MRGPVAVVLALLDPMDEGLAALRERLEQLDEQLRDRNGVGRGLRVKAEELALLRGEPELGHVSGGLHHATVGERVRTHCYPG